MQIKILFHNTVKLLKQANIPDPELEVSLLLSHVLQMERTPLLLAGEKVLEDHQLERLEKYIARRLAREPLAYITGEKEFWSLPFRVTRAVLIPRPETEFLLERALAVLQDSKSTPGQKIRILDLGTGSGVIAIILARELEPAEVTAVDLSYEALQVARHNAKKHKVAERIDFVNCNWLGAIAADAGFDIIISNPPYISEAILAQPSGRSKTSLQPEVVDFEPDLALNGGERGLREIIRIAAESGRALKPGGWLLMEIGADQSEEVLHIFQGAGVYGSMEVFTDYGGFPRVFQARRR